MIRIESVTRSYGRLVAVNSVSLEARRGEVFGLLGPNGAGKSTLVHLMVGLLKPDTGNVTLDGMGSPEDPSVRARIGVAPQALALYEELSGAENLMFFGQMQGLTGTRLRERVNWALEFVGLTERGRDRCKTYSGGMKRRLNLAVAMVHDPPVLLLDEPTVGVDPQSRNAILERIVELRRQGRTVVYTTHYMEEAQRVCDRVGIIDHGRLMAVDTVAQLIARHGGKDTLVVEFQDREERVETGDPVAELQRLQTNGKMIRFRVERPNLESVFLALTGRQFRD